MLTLLIVDDNPAFRAIARTVFSDAFLVVGEAADAGAALRSARELDPDVVLLDVELPDGDGFDVAAALARRGQRPAVVLTSGLSRQDLAPLIEESPARGFLEKDRLSPGVLCSLVRGA